MCTADNRGWRLICRDSAAIWAALPGDSHHRRLIDDLRCWTEGFTEDDGDLRR